MYTYVPPWSYIQHTLSCSLSHTHTHTHTNTHAHTHMHTHTDTHTHFHWKIYAECSNQYVCMHMYSQWRLRVYMCVQAYSAVCSPIYEYIRMYMYAYVLTRSHTAEIFCNTPCRAATINEFACICIHMCVDVCICAYRDILLRALSARKVSPAAQIFIGLQLPDCLGNVYTDIILYTLIHTQAYTHIHIYIFRYSYIYMYTYMNVFTCIYLYM